MLVHWFGFTQLLDLRIHDFYYSRKYNLDVLSPVDNQESLLQKLTGSMLKPTKVITDMLAENGSLLKLSYFCIVTATGERRNQLSSVQLHNGLPSIDAFRQDILDVIENDVKMVPPSGQVRIYNMVRDRGD